ncbi:hypothetical protein PI124_g17181 [Phytophthora idaei]|nr:hypothetical protein PI125_g19820 [Phytophthora idaei]KAG3237850.1 hypothetical protein PI124_g17181 [Phytophthora idaei]
MIPTENDEIIAVDAANGIDTVMEPEVLTGKLRSSLEAELEDIQEHKRQRDKGLQGMRRERQAMFAKGVLELIDESEMPSQPHLLNTMWGFQAKPDIDGFVTRWRPRWGGRGDFQEVGIDYASLSFQLPE